MISIIVIVKVTTMPIKLSKEYACLSRFDKIVYVVTIDLIMVTDKRAAHKIMKRDVGIGYAMMRKIHRN
jgi:hypothetical protein